MSLNQKYLIIEKFKFYHPETDLSFMTNFPYTLNELYLVKGYLEKNNLFIVCNFTHKSINYSLILKNVR